MAKHAPKETPKNSFAELKAKHFSSKGRERTNCQSFGDLEPARSDFQARQRDGQVDCSGR